VAYLCNLTLNYHSVYNLVPKTKFEFVVFYSLDIALFNKVYYIISFIIKNVMI